MTFMSGSGIASRTCRYQSVCLIASPVLQGSLKCLALQYLAASIPIGWKKRPEHDLISLDDALGSRGRLPGVESQQCGSPCADPESRFVGGIGFPGTLRMTPKVF